MSRGSGRYAAYHALWHLAEIGVLSDLRGFASPAWDAAQARIEGGARPTRVALIDTSVAADHPNLRDAVDADLSFDLCADPDGHAAFRDGARLAALVAAARADAGSASQDGLHRTPLPDGLAPAWDALLDRMGAAAAAGGPAAPPFGPSFAAHGTAMAGLIGARPLPPGAVPVAGRAVSIPAGVSLPQPAPAFAYAGVDPFCEIVPIATQFDASGAPVLDVALTDASYRAHIESFVGTPGGAPTAVVAGGGVVVSWNGATEVASWQLLDAAGNPVGAAQPKDGFETTLLVPAGTDPATLTVQALDAAGRPLTAESTTVTGSTYVSGLQVTAPVGPGSFDDGVLALPPFTAGFSLLGIAPASVQLGVFPFANTVQADFGPAGSTLTFQAKLKVTDFRVGPFGLQDFVGPSCLTDQPTTFTLTAPGDASQGSPLTGTYATSPFVGCGLLDPVATFALSRPDNTMTLRLPPASVAVTSAGAR